MKLYGNPSSVHSLGRSVKGLIEEAREEIADYLGVSHKEIYFTSGGTESNHLALRGYAHLHGSPEKSILYCGVEHSSVLGALSILESDGFSLVKIPVDSNGVPDLARIEAELPGAFLATFMSVNNETGVKLPLAAISDLCTSHDVCLHTDRVQELGKGSISLDGVSMASFSGHKIGAAKGIGVLYKVAGIEIKPLLAGGSQEKSLRAGTENIWGILSLQAAIAVLKEKSWEKQANEIREYFETAVLEAIPNLRINGSTVERVGNTSNITFLNCEGESLLFSLDMKGCCVSMGSACASGAVEPSHVLLEMGMPADEAKSTLRISFGRCNDRSQADGLIRTLVEVIPRLRKKR